MTPRNLRSVALSVLRNLDVTHAATDAAHDLRTAALDTLARLDACDAPPSCVTYAAPASTPTERAWYLDVPRDTVVRGPFLK